MFAQSSSKVELAGMAGSARLPGARVARLDRDVASGLESDQVLERMRRGEVDILVGMQRRPRSDAVCTMRPIELEGASKKLACG